MARSAHVDSMPLLKDLRASVVQFSEAARMALGEADADIQRTLSWLGTEALAHWKAQLRQRTQALAQARDQLRQKSLYKAPSGGRQSDVDEKLAVAAAQRKVEEAQAKLRGIERYRRQLEQEILLYRGQVQPVQRAIEGDLPRAVAMLDRVMDNLDAYVALDADRSAPGPSDADGSDRESTTRMARGSTPDDAAADARADADASDTDGGDTDPADATGVPDDPANPGQQETRP